MKTKHSSLSFYTINDNDLLVSEYNLSFEKSFILNDRKPVISGKEMLEDYFNTVYNVFLEKMKKFKELKCQASTEEVKSLTNMFKVLIDTQKMICGKKDEE